MSDDGGESACWAHLMDEMDTRGPARRVAEVDLALVPDDGRGAVWSLPHDGDLDANLVRLPPGQQIDQHVNNEVDVFVVVMEGDGDLLVDDREVRLAPGVAVLIPRGCGRTSRAGAGPLRYFTVHRRRDPLAIRPR